MKYTSIGAFEAKTHLGQLLDRVEQGEQIEITRRGRPVARLIPCEQAIDVDGIQKLITKVREERGMYHVTANDIADWKTEGRR